MKNLHLHDITLTSHRMANVKNSLRSKDSQDDITIPKTRRELFVEKLIQRYNSVTKVKEKTV